MQTLADDRLGRLLVEQGILSEVQMEECLRESRVAGGPLSDEIRRRGWSTPEQLRAFADESTRRLLMDGAARLLCENVQPSFTRFELFEPLGRGGAGWVYRALDRELGRRVALKVVPLGPDEEGRKRFHREARTAASLSHPHIVKIHDIGEEGLFAYIVMELVEGPSLAHALAGRRLSREQCLSILEKVARAAHEAHRQGIVHRDLKPGNIVLDASGDPKIVDFGLARLADADERLTKTGTAIGTPSYMAPEQIDGRNEEIDSRADVYSLGAILYEVLTGRPPHEGKSVLDLCAQVAMQDAVPPSSLVSDVPGALDAVCLKALERDREKRYASAEEFADDVRRFLDGGSVKARRPGPVRQAFRWMGTHPVAALLVFGVLAFGTAAAVSWRERNVRRAAFMEMAQERKTLVAQAEVYLPVERELHQLRLRGYRESFRMTDEQRSLYEALEKKVQDQVSRTGECAQASFLSGRIRHVLGDRAEARKHYDRGLELQKDHPACLLWKTFLQVEGALLVRFSTQKGPEAERRKKDVRESLKKALDRIGGLAAPGIAPRDVDLLRGYMHIVAGEESSGYAGRMLEKWKGEDFSEEFYLVRGLSGGPDDVAADATRAIEKRPAFAEAYFWRGVALHSRNDLQEAVRDYDRALEIAPRFAAAWNQRGLARLSQGDAAGAARDFGRAIDADADFASAYDNRGSAYQELKDFERAQRDFDRAIELDPRSGMTWFNRGNMKLGWGKPKEALEDYDKAVEFDPTNENCYANRGVARYDLGDFEGAVREYGKALEVNPSFPDACANRANARAAWAGKQAGDDARRLWREVVSDYEAALRVAPDPSPRRAQYQAALEEARRRVQALGDE